MLAARLIKLIDLAVARDEPHARRGAIGLRTTTTATIVGIGGGPTTSLRSNTSCRILKTDEQTQFVARQVKPRQIATYVFTDVLAGATRCVLAEGQTRAYVGFPDVARSALAS